MSGKRSTQSPEAKAHSERILEEGHREALSEAAETLGSCIDEAIRHAKEHQENLKEPRYRTTRALQLGAAQIIESLAGIKTIWALNEDDFRKAVERWHEEMEDPSGA
ncbi:MAG: hypothetical protein V3T23_12995 [Nitrososphaerales archaeon]